MSQRAAYLRDQADQLQWHAARITDAEIKEQLRKLAVEYIERAALAETEGEEWPAASAAERNRGSFTCAINPNGMIGNVSSNRFHAREAAAALLKMAKTTSDPKVAAGLVEAAASLKEQAGELPPPVSAKPPDVQ